MSRTWMRLTTGTGNVIDVAVEEDVITDVVGIKHLFLRADDTLSRWANMTDSTIERVDAHGDPE